MTDQEKVPVRTGTPEERAVSRGGTFAYDPFEQMDRLFDRLMGGGWMRPMGGLWPQTGAAGRAPRMDVIDRDNDILVRAEIPGVAKEDLDLSLNDRTVTLRGTVRREQKKEEGDYYFAETSQGEFSRTVALPAEVDGSKAKASYRDGVVELTLPKAETAKRHRIPIESE